MIAALAALTLTGCSMTSVGPEVRLAHGMQVEGVETLKKARGVLVTAYHKELLRYSDLLLEKTMDLEVERSSLRAFEGPVTVTTPEGDVEVPAHVANSILLKAKDNQRTISVDRLAALRAFQKDQRDTNMALFEAKRDEYLADPTFEALEKLNAAVGGWLVEHSLFMDRATSLLNGDFKSLIKAE